MSYLPFHPVLIIGLLQIAALWAQAPATLADFLHAIADRSSFSAVPTREEAFQFEKQIEAYPPEELSKLLPLVFAALMHQESVLSGYGTESLIAISLRPDGAELLRPHLEELFTLLNSANLPLANVSVMVLAYQKPEPPEEVTLPILAFAKRTDRNTIVQARALSVPLYAAYLGEVPDRPDVLDAIEEFMRRPLDGETRITMMDVIAAHPQRSSRSARLTALILSALHDPLPAVRGRAIYEVERLGRDVLATAAPDLQRMAVDPRESVETRAAADRALRVWVGGDQK